MGCFGVGVMSDSSCEKSSSGLEKCGDTVIALSVSRFFGLCLELRFFVDTSCHSFFLKSGILIMGSWLGLEPQWLLKVITNGSHYCLCPPLPLCYLRQKMIPLHPLWFVLESFIQGERD